LHGTDTNIFWWLKDGFAKNTESRRKVLAVSYAFLLKFTFVVISKIVSQHTELFKHVYANGIIFGKHNHLATPPSLPKGQYVSGH
jgi:hypothetical protein